MKVGKYSVADPSLSSNESDYLRTNSRAELISVISGTTGNLVQATTDGALKVSTVTAANVIVNPSTAVAAGTIGLTSDAAQFTAQACVGALIQSDKNNAVDILIGTSGSMVYRVEPGDSISADIANLNLLYGKTTGSTATVNWLTGSS